MDSFHIRSESTPDTAALNGNVEPGQPPSLHRHWVTVTFRLRPVVYARFQLFILDQTRTQCPCPPFRLGADSSATPDPPHDEAPPSALLGALQPLPETGAPP